MSELFHSIHNFLVNHDFPTLIIALRGLDWTEVARSGYTWLIVVPTVTFLLWTKRIKTTVALVSVFFFVLLIQKTLSPATGSLALNDLVTFLGGAVVIIGINLYMVFIRQ